MPATPTTNRQLDDSTVLRPATQRTRRGGVIRRVLRWLRNGAGALAVLLVAAIAAGQVQQHRLTRAHPAPGQMIDVGGHNLHVIRAGHGPTVVFENGPGGMALDWTLVQPQIARSASTFAYDRGGIAWSDPGPRPRDITTLVDELHHALHAADAPAPYVLVGHSFGGLVVRAFAYTYPDEVAGLVLLDAAHEDQLAMYPTAYADKYGKMTATMSRMRPVFAAANASGIPALLASRHPSAVADRLPDHVGRSRRAIGLVDGSQAAAVVDEMAALADGFASVRSIRRPLGDLPVVVVTRENVVGEEAGVPAGLEHEVHAAWLRMQRDLTTISTNSRLLVAKNSSHDIHLDRPDIVIDAVQSVLTQITAS